MVCQLRDINLVPTSLPILRNWAQMIYLSRTSRFSVEEGVYQQLQEGLMTPSLQQVSFNCRP